MTNEEKAKAAYTWILINITYDYDCNPFCQYSDLNKILQTKKGICYDIANLFTAICHSQNIPSYSMDGCLKADYKYKYTWKRVCIDGMWYTIDITADLSAKTPYGFCRINSYNEPDSSYIIMRVY